MRLRFGLDDGMAKTIKRVTEIMGIKVSKARKLEKSAMGKLRHPDVLERMVDFLASE